jgi:hypothetical protein
VQYLYLVATSAAVGASCELADNRLRQYSILVRNTRRGKSSVTWLITAARMHEYVAVPTESRQFKTVKIKQLLVNPLVLVTLPTKLTDLRTKGEPVRISTNPYILGLNC